MRMIVNGQDAGEVAEDFAEKLDIQPGDFIIRTIVQVYLGKGEDSLSFQIVGDRSMGLKVGRIYDLLVEDIEKKEAESETTKTED